MRLDYCRNELSKSPNNQEKARDRLCSRPLGLALRAILSLLLIVAILPVPAIAWALPESKSHDNVALMTEEIVEDAGLEEESHAGITGFTSFNLVTGEETPLSVSPNLPLPTAGSLDSEGSAPPKEGELSTGTGLIKGPRAIFNENRIAVPIPLLTSHPYICIGIVDATFYDIAQDAMVSRRSTGWIFADYAVITSADAVYDPVFGLAQSVVFRPIYQEDPNGVQASSSFDAISASVPDAYVDFPSKFSNYAILAFETNLGDIYGYFGYKTFTSLASYTNMISWLTGYPASFDNTTNPPGYGCSRNRSLLSGSKRPNPLCT
jgi:hypothetical protein